MKRARNAGGAVGMCGAASVGMGGAERARRRAREGRRPAHACRSGQAGGWGRCARARAGAGRGARTSDSISTTSPVERPRGCRRKSAREFGGRAGALTPETVAPGRALGLLWLLHRLRLLRARATAGSCCWGQAGHRAHLTRPQRPRRDEEHLLGARQRRGTSSPSPSSRTERSQLVLRRVHGCSPPVCKRRKRRTASEGQPNPAQSTWASGGQGPAFT